MKSIIKKLMITSLVTLIIIPGFTYSQDDVNKINDKVIVINAKEIKDHQMKMNNMTMNDSNKTVMTGKMKGHNHKDMNSMMDSCKMMMDKTTMPDSCKMDMDSCKMMMNKPEHKKLMKDNMMMNNPEHKKMMKNMKDNMNMNHSPKMKKEVSIVREGIIDLVSIDENKDGKVFQDVMDWNVISDEPGTCPLCGMKLQEVTLEKAKENLLKKGFEVKDIDNDKVINENNINTNKTIWNKYCPVTGMKVNPKSKTVEYEGKIIGFCCAGSEHYKTFLEDPVKYLNNLSSDGQDFIGKKKS